MQPAKSEGSVSTLNREDATIDSRGRFYQPDARLPPHTLFWDSENQIPATLPTQYPNPDVYFYHPGVPFVFGSSSNPMPFNPILPHDCHTAQETVLAAQYSNSRTEPTASPLIDTDVIRPRRIENSAGVQSDKNQTAALVDCLGPDENQTDVPIRRRRQDSKGKSKADAQEPPRKRTKKAPKAMKSTTRPPTARKQNAMITGITEGVQFRFISVYPEQDFSGTGDQSTTKLSEGVSTVVSDSSSGPQTPLVMDSLSDRHYNAIPQPSNARSASPAEQVNAACAASSSHKTASDWQQHLIVGDNHSVPSTAAPTCKPKKKQSKAKQSKNTDKIPWTNKQDPVLSAKIRDHICYQKGCSAPRTGQFDKKPVLSFWCLKHAEEKYQQDPTQPSLERSFGRCQ